MRYKENINTTAKKIYKYNKKTFVIHANTTEQSNDNIYYFFVFKFMFVCTINVFDI